MSKSLQQHGRGIAAGFPGVTHRQAADCGELVSQFERDGEEEEGLPLSQQIGIGLALLVLLIGAGAALGGA